MNTLIDTPSGTRAVMSDASWHVLHTRSNQEFEVARFMRGLGAGVFFPTVRKPAQRGRRGHPEVPAFPGYVFVHADDATTYTADRTRRLVRIISVIDQDQIAREIASLEIALAATPDAEPYPELRTGVAVRVIRGPMSGAEGLIASWRRPERLLLNVATLGQGIDVEVDAADLEVNEHQLESRST